MESFNDDLVLSTSDVAELLSVHPSTVKRWCEDGGLGARRTEGGHRRFRLEPVLTAAREREIETFLDDFAPYQAHVWTALRDVREDGSYGRAHSLAMGWLARGHHARVGRLFATLGRHPGVSFGRFLDEGVAGFMERVGRAWRDGRLRVGEEHLITQVLVEVLLDMRRVQDSSDEDLPAPSRNGTRPESRAVVGATEGDRHDLGALSVRLILEREGWDVLYVGSGVPVEDFASVQRAREASLVCLSFSPPGTGTDPRRALRLLEGLYDRARPYALALGGGGVRPEDVPDDAGPFREARRFRGVGDFRDALRAGFGGGS